MTAQANNLLLDDAQSLLDAAQRAGLRAFGGDYTVQPVDFNG
jgi:hypothetical protein